MTLILKPLKPLHKTKIVTAITIATFSVISSHSFADVSTVLETETIESTTLPTRLKSKRQDAIAISTTILTEKELSRYLDIPQALTTEANIDTFNQGGLGGLNSVFLRGSNSTQTLILLDGVPFNNFSSGASPLSQIAISSIAKIEISRGNLSSLYGSQAMGGVIHIETKKGSNNNGNTNNNQISIGLGRYNRFETQVNLSTATSSDNDAVKLNLYGGHTQQSGFSAIDAKRVLTANPDKDGLNQFNGGFNLSQTYAKGHDWQLTGQSLDNTVGYDNYGFGADATDKNTIRNRLQSISLLANNQIDDAWHSQVKLGQNRFTDKTIKNNQVDFSGLNKNYFVSTQQTVDLAKTIGFGGKIYVGYEKLGQHFTENAALNLSENRTVNSQFLGYIQQFGATKNHGIQLNWRRDNFSDFGSANTGLVAYQYQRELSHNDSIRFGIQGSTAFKAPTFNDLYYPNYSNSNLKPEKSRSKEMTLAYLRNEMEIQGTLFDNQYRDLVGYDAITYLPVNVNRANIKGLELQVKNRWDFNNFALANLQLGAMGTWQQPINQADNKEELLLRRPKRLFSAFVQTQLASKKQDIRIEYVARSSRHDFDINDFSTINVAGFNVLNTQINHRMTNNTNIQFRLENALNKQYQITDGYQTAGRTWLLRLTHQF